jgi:hypothetical protein
MRTSVVDQAADASVEVRRIQGGAVRVLELARDMHVADAHRQHLDPFSVQAAGHREPDLVLAPARIDGSSRDERDHELHLMDGRRDGSDERVPRTQRSFVDPDGEALGLEPRLDRAR